MMNGRYLLDTNILIDLFDQDENVIAKIEKAEEVFIPINALGELYYGAYNSTQQARHIAETVQVEANIAAATASRVAADFYGQIRSRLRKIGNPIPENDIWIAAIAMEHDLTVLTGDKHFQAIEGLKLELWVREEK